MKNTLKVAPLFVLALIAFGCGGGGGAAGSPEEIGEGVKDAIVSENFTDVYSYIPAWQIESSEGRTAVKKWRMEEGWEKWKPLKERLEKLDPKDKSEIIDEDKWKEASNAQRLAVFMGFYKCYAADKWENRLKEGLWYLSSRDVDLDPEGQGDATMIYQNKYNDTITVRAVRENGLWSLRNASLEMAEDLPEKPEGD